MGFFNNFPYTNFHEMNLDWICKNVKENTKLCANAVKTADDAKNYVENVDYSSAADDAIKKLYQNGDLETYANYRFFAGKNIVIIGDSNSDETATWGVMPNWVYYMRQKLDGVAKTITNNSVSGRRWVGSYENVSSVLEAIEESSTAIVGADIVILFAGVNDYSNSSPLGDFNSDDITTFNGAVRKGLDRIVALNSRVQIVVISPLDYSQTAFTHPLSFYRIILSEQSKKCTFINGNGAPGYRWEYKGADQNSLDGLHINPKYAPTFAEYVLNSISSGGQSYRDVNMIVELNKYASGSVSNANVFAEISNNGLVTLSGYFSANVEGAAFAAILTNLPDWLSSYTDMRLLCISSSGVHGMMISNGAIHCVINNKEDYSFICTPFYSKQLHSETFN